MPNLTCPYPVNINPLTPNGFLLNIEKLPEVTYFCQSASLPQISLGNSSQATPFIDVNLPGDKLEYANLNVRFIIDEEMANYIAIHNWMTGIGFPESNEQFLDFIRNQDSTKSTAAKLVSDATLSILNSNFVATKTVRFIDVFPVNLSTSEDFQSTNTDSSPLIGMCTFLFSYYKFE